MKSEELRIVCVSRCNFKRLADVGVASDLISISIRFDSLHACMHPRSTCPRDEMGREREREETSNEDEVAEPDTHIISNRLERQALSPDSQNLAPPLLFLADRTGAH